MRIGFGLIVLLAAFALFTTPARADAEGGIGKPVPGSQTETPPVEDETAPDVETRPEPEMVPPVEPEAPAPIEPTIQAPAPLPVPVPGPQTSDRRDPWEDPERNSAGSSAELNIALPPIWGWVTGNVLPRVIFGQNVRRGNVWRPRIRR
ncbi:MAG: hypothetical protein FJX76_15345 [Armatimonadetes bacterium]|nr:hypothetical protein [Armatimonadota bacterium]